MVIENTSARKRWGLPNLTPSQILVIGFAVLIFLGAALLTLPAAVADGQSIRFLDALFTSTSATCVTGLIVFDTGTKFSLFGQIVIITLIQIGGLGFMTFSTLIALIIRKKIGLRARVVMQEAFNLFTPSGVVRLAVKILLITAFFEVSGAIILSWRFAQYLPLGTAIYYGIFHSISAFCNAGFDLLGRIFGPFASIVPLNQDFFITMTVSVLVIFGGLGFPVIANVMASWGKKRERLVLHSRLVITMTVLLLVIGTLLVWAIEYANPETLGPLPGWAKVTNAFFHSMTTRTAGYNSVNIGAMHQATLFISTALMFIGASPCSTGGGVKTSTLGVLLASVVSIIKGKRDTEIFRRRIATDAVFKAIAVIFIALSVVLLVTLVLSITEAAPFLNLLFEAMSAFGTVGLTTGITPTLSDIGRVLIIALMYIGRLGPLTLAVAIGQRHYPPSLHYPEERVMIG
ncbi:MAG TPA: Trk family potassium uptake protein [Firmicutes bacterium]|jgi:trk system potassium uptake protein TrkH|nr:Trk family potassium uptake protein [Bacillota bacterium]